MFALAAVRGSRIVSTNCPSRIDRMRLPGSTRATDVSLTEYSNAGLEIAKPSRSRAITWTGSVSSRASNTSGDSSIVAVRWSTTSGAVTEMPVAGSYSVNTVTPGVSACIVRSPSNLATWALPTRTTSMGWMIGDPRLSRAIG